MTLSLLIVSSTFAAEPEEKKLTINVQSNCQSSGVNNFIHVTFTMYDTSQVSIGIMSFSLSEVVPPSIGSVFCSHQPTNYLSLNTVKYYTKDNLLTQKNLDRLENIKIKLPAKITLHFNENHELFITAFRSTQLPLPPHTPSPAISLFERTKTFIATHKLETAAVFSAGIATAALAYYNRQAIKSGAQAALQKLRSLVSTNFVATK